MCCKYCKAQSNCKAPLIYTPDILRMWLACAVSPVELILTIRTHGMALEGCVPGSFLATTRVESLA